MEKLNSIKFLVMDVDGTLTDGKIYMGVDGEVLKAFDIKDGYALHALLKEYDIIPVIITARKSPMVEHRCKELGVTEIHQGVMEKLDCLMGILEEYSSEDKQYDLSHVAYIGDDLLDLRCMGPIKQGGGIVGCPSNAVKEVIEICEFVSTNKGGEGAVRDFAEYVIKRKKALLKIDNSLESRLSDAIMYIASLDHSKIKPGCYEVNQDFFYLVQEYQSISEDVSVYESHRCFIDIQWVVLGKEALYVTDANKLIPADMYNEEKDVIHYQSSDSQTKVLLTSGSCAVLFPKDAHRPGRYLDEICHVLKIVGKLRIW